MEPSYQDLKAADIPDANPSPDVHVKVICGSAQGSAEEGLVSSPVRPLGGCWYFDVTLKAKGASTFMQLPAGWNAFVSSVILFRPSLPSDLISPLSGRLSINRY